MKRIYMIMAVIAAMTMNAQAQDPQFGTIEVGDFEAPTEVYDGSYFDMAPTNFYLAHTGVQMIYTVNELADIQALKDVKINQLAFKFYNEGAYEEISRDVKLYLEEIDATEFNVIKGVKQFFAFDNLVSEYSIAYDMLEYYGEDVEMVLDLSESPFAINPGKSLLVTAVFDAQDDDNCTVGSSYAPFYTSGVRSKAMLYTDNWTSFVDYAQGEDFPDATAMLGCGTNVDLPVTRILYSHSKFTGVEEVQAATTGDNAYYNLMGQKFAEGNLAAGIYIHNGKKVIVR